ncbi:MAG: MBOAT family protein, partial [Coriobacteriaceae bacterium]|nr:MBOAT family protein [Coriobacteriaceae bacterium]
MELFSAQFLIFLVVAWCVYMVLGRVRPGIQWAALLAASLAFYAIAGGWQSLVYVVGAATVSWAAATWLEKLEEQSKAARKAVSDRAEKKAIKARYVVRKRLVLIGALAICLGVLGYLKYWETILGYLMPGAGHLGLVLPLGISFFTFQVTGYVIDVYNGKEPAERSYAKHLLFTTYFPQLIQGPINKHRTLAPQLTAPHAFDAHGMRRGLVRLALGIFKKFSVAVMLQKTVGDIFGNVDDAIPGALVLVGLLAYNAQLYGDFSGGIDM